MGESRVATAAEPELLYRRAGARFALELWHVPAIGSRLALLRLRRRPAVAIRRRDAAELREALGDLLERGEL